LTSFSHNQFPKDLTGLAILNHLDERLSAGDIERTLEELSS
jgi:hypothetical protein